MERPCARVSVFFFTRVTPFAHTHDTLWIFFVHAYSQTTPTNHLFPYARHGVCHRPSLAVLRQRQGTFQSAIGTSDTAQTSQLERLDDTSTLPGMYTSMKASILVNGEGSTTAQLTVNEDLVKKLSKSVMIDLKDNLAVDAVEQVDEITVALHTKDGHENGASDVKTLRPVLSEQVGTHTYVDVSPDEWDQAYADYGAPVPSTSYLRVQTPIVSSLAPGPAMPLQTGYYTGYDPQLKDIEGPGGKSYIQPLNLGLPFKKDKLFPLVIITTSSGMGITDATPSIAYSSVDIAMRKKLPVDAVVVQIMAKSWLNGNVYSINSGSNVVYRMVDWCLANLPQIDPTQVSLWGSSLGSLTVFAYAAKFDGRVKEVAVDAGGSGYAVGDVLTALSPSGGRSATLTVDAVNPSTNAVTTLSITDAGMQFYAAVGKDLSLSGGSGSGARVLIVDANRNNNGVTHGITGGIGINPILDSVILPSKFTLPIYTIAFDGDELGFSLRNTYYSRFLKECPGFRLTMLQGNYSSVDDFPQTRRLDFLKENYQETNDVKPTPPNHYLQASTIDLHDELVDHLKLRTTPFDAPSEWDPLTQNSPYISPWDFIKNPKYLM